MCFLPCCAACGLGAALAANKATSAFDNLFEKPAPQDNPITTELRLFSPGQEPAPSREKRARTVSRKEAESKARLQRLIDENLGGPEPRVPPPPRPKP
ncbi:hypothetical protein H632_c192p1 [Helicosporidium sp. ATCC 50920]|nr:hypothetical protein H632_c192p1 [Helicosporidium sp. ATCC 50920]|eukprot:KDD76533.1 hypothetical protein H632_c192p1 [Helicosporidium sp. ATCC 50920]